MTLGGQPQVLTFALDELLGRGHRLVDVVAICVATRAPRVRAAHEVLAAEFAGDRYGGQPCRLRLVAVRSGADERDDIQDATAAEATWQVMHRVIGQLKAEGRRMLLVRAGCVRCSFSAARPTCCSSAMVSK